VLGVSWDGTGFGTDGTIWGGEFLLVNDSFFERFAHLRQFRLPGGEAAIREPRRSALGLLYEILQSASMGMNWALEQFTPGELKPLERMLASGINSPLTSSAGRLFDAVAALIGIRQRASFEGQAAMELEFAISPGVEVAYPFEIGNLAGLGQSNGERGSARGRARSKEINWQPMIMEILREFEKGQASGIIAAKFVNTLVEMIVAVAKQAAEPKVVLTGGCFQNQYLAERAICRLRKEGFQPYWHRRVPPNDGGIALGQVWAAARTHVGQPVPRRLRQQDHYPKEASEFVSGELAIRGSLRDNPVSQPAV
jgi:hydrogenase maturation protein HypF